MAGFRPIHWFSVLVGLGLLLVFSLSYFYGGGHVLFWNAATLASLAKEQIATRKVLLASVDFDERTYKKEMLGARTLAPDVLVLGSSRVFQMEGHLFVPEGREFYNAGLSGATLEDHAGIWQACVELGAVPKVVFWGIDPWLFNDNSGGSRWETLDGEFRRFKYSYLESGPSLPYYLADRTVHRIWLQLTDLVSMPRFRQAVKSIGRSFAAREAPTSWDGEFVLVDERLVPAEGSGFRIDGSLLDPHTGVASDSKALAEARAGKFLMLNDWHRLSESRIRLLEKLLEEMHAHGVNVVGVTLPYAPAYFDILQARKDYARLLRQQSLVLRDIFSRFPFPYIDALDPRVLNLSSGDFRNVTHLTSNGTGKAVTYLLEQSALSKAGQFEK